MIARPARRRPLAEALRNDAVRQVAHTMSSRVAMLVVGIASSVVIARTLGPSGRGTYAVAATIVGLGVQIGNAGIQTANTYYIAQDRALTPALIGNSLAVGMGAALIVCGMFGAIAQMVPGIAPIQGVLLWASLAAIPFGLTSLFLQNLLIGLGRIRDVNRIDVGTRVLGFAAIVTALVLGGTDVVTLFLVGLVVLPVGVGISGWRLRSAASERPTFDRAVLARTLRYGAKAWVIALFSYLVVRADLLIVDRIRGTEDAGFYSVAVALADLVYMLPAVVGTVIFPRLSATADREERWAMASRALLTVTGLLVAGAAVAAVAAGPVITVAYGSEFASAVSPFLWLLPGMVFLGAETIIAQFLAASGMPRSLIAAWVVAFVLNVALNVAWVPAHGPGGAAAASTLTYGMMLIAAYLVTRRVRGPLDAPRILPVGWRRAARLVPTRSRPRVGLRIHRWLRKGTLLRSLRRKGRRVTPTLYGTSLMFDPEVDADFQGIAVIGSYEVGTSELCVRILRPGDVAVDVGANIGWFTTLFAKCVGPEGRVIAFEPNAVTFERLLENVELCGHGSVVALPLAVGSVSREVAVRLPPGAPHGHASVVAVTAVGSPEHVVRQVTLDHQLEELGVSAPLLVKVDVEGSEAAVLEGASRTLEAAQPPMWIFEVNDGALARASASRTFLERLTDRGYEMLRIDAAWGPWRPARSIDDIDDGDNVLCFLRDVHHSRIADL